MTNTITSTPFSTAGPTTTGSVQNSQTAGTSQDSLTNENTFLKLLVAQMKNQDPTSPTDPTQMVSQLTQYSELEQLMQINSGVHGLTGSAASPTSATNPTTPATPTTHNTTGVA